MHPKTAHHIAYKLAQRFVADEPPAELVDRAAKKFLETKGNLREVTRVIITSPEVLIFLFFMITDPRTGPAGSVGRIGVTALPMVQALQQLGMPLYGAQPPTGYSMTADAWVNTGALVNRMNFAQQLVNGGVPQNMGQNMGPGRGGPGRADRERACGCASLGTSAPPPPAADAAGR